MQLAIAFYKGTRPGLQGVFNRAVRWWTNGPYSHVEIVFGDENNDGVLCASASGIDGGVRFKRIIFDQSRWDIVDITKVFGDKRQGAYLWFSNNQGAKYDTLGLFGFVWRRGDGSGKRWFCSEAVCASLGMIEPWRYDPNSLFSTISSMAKAKGL